MTDTDEELFQQLKQHQEDLQTLAQMDVPASEDARRALAILDGAEEGQS